MFLRLVLPCLNPIYLIFHSFHPSNAGDRLSSHHLIPERDWAHTGYLLWHSSKHSPAQPENPFHGRVQPFLASSRQAMHSWRYLQPLCPGVDQTGRMLAMRAAPTSCSLGNLPGPHTEHLQAGTWVGGTLGFFCQCEVVWWHHCSSKDELMSSQGSSSPWDLLEQSFYRSVVPQRNSSLDSNTHLQHQA